jgi:hypothetical protein
MKSFHFRKSLAVHFIVGVIALPTLATSAVTYDLGTDWANNATYVNPNGPWAYLQGTSLLPHETGGVWGSSNVFAPGNVTGNFLPAFLGLIGDFLVTHSVDGYNGNPALGQSILTWTAPTAGTISITGAVWNPQVNPNDPSVANRENTFTLYLGGVELTSGNVFAAPGTHSTEATAITFSFSSLPVANGEVLSLVNVADQAAGTESAIQLTITESPVPLPVSLLLFAPGLTCLVAIRRRFKK